VKDVLAKKFFLVPGKIPPTRARIGSSENSTEGRTPDAVERCVSRVFRQRICLPRGQLAQICFADS
jgi:hypothetical protein